MRRNDSVLRTVLVVAAFLTALCAENWATPVPFSARGEERTVRSLLATLAQKMKGVETIQTTFTQTKQLQMFKREIVLTGSAYMQKPGRFAWHTKTPIRNSIVLENNRARQWNEDTDKVETLPIDKLPALKTMVNHMQAWFHGLYIPMLEEYDVRVVALEPLTLEFQPQLNKSTATIIKMVRITFAPDQRSIRSFNLVDKNGDRSLIEFKNTVVNGHLDESIWEVRRKPE